MRKHSPRYLSNKPKWGVSMTNSNNTTFLSSEDYKRRQYQLLRFLVTPAIYHEPSPDLGIHSAVQEASDAYKKKIESLFFEAGRIQWGAYAHGGFTGLIARFNNEPRPIATIYERVYERAPTYQHH